MNEQARQPFSWGVWIGGLAVALFVGLIMNFVFGFLAIAMGNTAAAVLIELIPGAILALASFRGRRSAFPQGVLVGAAIVAIIGGLCGTTLGNGFMR